MRGLAPAVTDLQMLAWIQDIGAEQSRAAGSSPGRTWQERVMESSSDGVAWIPLNRCGIMESGSRSWVFDTIVRRLHPHR
jgi:hypothetical protein